MSGMVQLRDPGFLRSSGNLLPDGFCDVDRSGQYLEQIKPPDAPQSDQWRGVGIYPLRHRHWSVHSLLRLPQPGAKGVDFFLESLVGFAENGYLEPITEIDEISHRETSELGSATHGEHAMLK